MRNAEAFLNDIRDKYGYDTSINNSYRTYEEQERLYRQWLSRKGKGNPAAKPGASRHEAGFAFDINRLQELSFIQWNRVLNLGEQYGFEYLLGDWPGEGTQKFDWPHFQADPMDYGTTLGRALARNRVTQSAIRGCDWKPSLPEESKVYLRKIVVTKAHFAPANGNRDNLTYIEGEFANTGSRKIAKLEFRVELYDSLGDLLRVRILHPAISSAGVEPGRTVSFRVLFGRLNDFWRDGPLKVLPNYVEVLGTPAEAEDTQGWAEGVKQEAQHDLGRSAAPQKRGDVSPH